jgi:drug/metabolite transporter (DMT)-like permease
MTDATFERHSGMVLTGYRKGLALTAAGTLFASFEGLLVRLVSADSWTVIFWRGILLGIAMMLFIACSRRRLVLRGLSRAGWIAVAAYACNVCFFISAINATTVANTLVIASAAPLFAAAIGWAALRERPDKETWVAVLVVFVGLAVIFSGSLGGGRLTGDLLALGYAIALAAYFVALQRCPETQVPSIVAIGGILSGLVAWPFAGGIVVATGDLWPLLLLGLVVVPAATLMLSFGPQFMPGSHVTLIMLLEILLGPLWVWMMFRETPSVLTVLGGALVLATIVAHSWASTRRASRTTVAADIGS